MIHSIVSLWSGMIVILNDFFRNYSSAMWSHFWPFAYGKLYIFNGGTTESGLETKVSKVLKSSEHGPSYGWLLLDLRASNSQIILNDSGFDCIACLA